MTLGDKQRLFPHLWAQFTLYVYMAGYETTKGDAMRDERVFGKMGESKGYGHRNSCHKLKLAEDMNLFKDGKYLTETEDHRHFGEYWESMHPLNKWGGRFKKPDGNHYSMTHNGHM